MRIEEILGNSKHIEKVKQIYLNSFPAKERIEVEDLIGRKFPNSKILGIFNNKTLIGFSFVSTYKKYAYIVYLAIDEKYRNQNYGTLAINTLCEMYKDKIKVLCVEKPIQKDDIPTRRIGFYKKNGFSVANFEFEYWEQDYYTMYNGDFNKQEFLDFLFICFPDSKNFKDIC